MQRIHSLMSRDEYYDHLRCNDFGACAFCEWKKWQVVLDRTPNWIWIASLSPYFKYHTMFVPLRHIVDIDELTNAEFDELKIIKRRALDQYVKADLHHPDGQPVNMFSYEWRVRQGGIDKTFGVTKSVHLHLHMWPERDGLMSSITDPEAHMWNTDLLKLKPNRKILKTVLRK